MKRNFRARRSAAVAVLALAGLIAVPVVAYSSSAPSADVANHDRARLPGVYLGVPHPATTEPGKRESAEPLPGKTQPAKGRAAKPALHDDMRKLWEQHVVWTRLAIVEFAAGWGGFDTTAERLLQNQVDIGDAMKPYFGDAAGGELTALLHDHITIAFELVAAAKNGDTEAFEDAKTRWYANANDIADFLAEANPKYWPQDKMRRLMKTHLDQTLNEAGNILNGNFAASVEDFDQIETHILKMADVLSNGIIRAFPHKFR